MTERTTIAGRITFASKKLRATLTPSLATSISNSMEYSRQRIVDLSFSLSTLLVTACWKISRNCKRSPVGSSEVSVCSSHFSKGDLAVVIIVDLLDQLLQMQVRLRHAEFLQETLHFVEVQRFVPIRVVPDENNARALQPVCLRRVLLIERLP